jgi:hypothetical protein
VEAGESLALQHALSFLSSGAARQMVAELDWYVIVHYEEVQATSRRKDNGQGSLEFFGDGLSHGLRRFARVSVLKTTAEQNN